MKVLFNCTTIFVLALIVSCSGSGRDEQSTTAKVVQEAKPEPFSFNEKYKGVLKEHLFFHLREKVVNIDGNAFVKYEHLMVEGLKFEYSAVIVDHGMMDPLVHHDPLKPKIILASYKQRVGNEQLGDSIIIKGTIEILDSLNTTIEEKFSDITIRLKAKFTNSYLTTNPYSYDGFERIKSDDDLTQQLIVKLNEPKIYAKENMYLKARVKEFTEDDLSIFKKEELAYLRNELFARHGHVFKTDRMKAFFTQKEWYVPYFDDATELLNEVEKKNVRFIKSLES